MGNAILALGIGNTLNTSAAGATEYWYGCSGRLTKDTTENNRKIKYRAAGTLSKLYVRLSANATSASSTIKTRKNGADGNQSVSIGSAATGEFTDSSNSDTIAAADDVCIQSITGTGGALTPQIISMLFAASTSANTVTVMSCDEQNHSTASRTAYMTLSGMNTNNGNGTENNVQSTIRIGGSFKNGATYVSANARTTTTTYTLRKNAADTAIVMSIGSTATGLFEDTADTLTVTAGEEWNWKHVTGTDSNTLTQEYLKIEFETTGSTNNGLAIGGTNDNAQANPGFGTTTYSSIGMTAKDTTETNKRLEVRVASTFSQLVYYIPSNSVNGSSTGRLRKNGANGSQSVTIGSTATGAFVDTTNSDTLVATDEMCYQLVCAGTTGTMDVRGCGCVTVAAAAAAQNITKSLATETVSLSESLGRLNGKIRTRTETAISITENRARLAAKQRALGTQTTTIAEVSLVRVKGKVKALATETITISEASLSLLRNKIRTASDTVTKGESATRLAAKNKALATETITITGGTLARLKGAIKSLTTEIVTKGEGIARLTAKQRTIPTQTTSLGESRNRLAAKSRLLTTQSTSVGESLARIKGTLRVLATQTTTISEVSLTRLLAKTRPISLQTLTIGENAARLKAAMRSLAIQTITVAGGSVVRLVARQVTRALATQTVVLSESVAKLLAKSRAISQTVPSAESAARLKGARRTALEIVTISEQITRIKSAVKSLALQSVALSQSTVRLAAKIRTFLQTITIGDSVFAEVSGELARGISQTVAVAAGTLSRMVTKVRAPVVETVPLSQQLVRIKSIFRTLAVQTTNIFDSIVRLLAKQRVIIQSIPAIPETLTRIAAKARALTPQSTSVGSGIVTREVNQLIKHIVRTLADTVAILDNAFIKEISKFKDRYHKITTPSIKRLRGNHPAYILGTRGQHDNYIDF